MKKDRDTEISKAVEILNKALAIEEPDITIYIPYGLDNNTTKDREFLEKLKVFVGVYKKFTGLEKINLKFIV